MTPATSLTPPAQPGDGRGPTRDIPLTVYLVDDDPAIRDSVSLSLSLRGYTIAQFASAEDLLASYDTAWAGCIVADLRMPGMSGLDLQAALTARGSTLPVIFITAHGDVASARAAFRGQAIDFLEKPFDDAHLINAIETAYNMERGRIGRQHNDTARMARLTALSPRERDVLAYLARGMHAREIGEQLGISHRTVEVHKAHIMEKLGVHSVIEIVRMAEAWKQ